MRSALSRFARDHSDHNATDYVLIAGLYTVVIVATVIVVDMAIRL